MSVVDKEMMKRVRAQVARRYVDSSMVTISVIGGIVHLTGVVSALRTHPNSDVREEMEQIAKAIRAMHGIHDVIWDVSIRT